MKRGRNTIAVQVADAARNSGEDRASGVRCLVTKVFFRLYKYTVSTTTLLPPFPSMGT